MRRKRWLLGTLLVLLALGAGLLIAARLYLRSSAVAARIAARLRQKLGIPVRVAEADIGLFGDSTVRNVEMYESDTHAHPWATVSEMSTDISVLDLLRGAVNPRQITLKGVRADLHFDKDGRLLTKMPELEEEPAQEAPTITLQDAQITLHQQGAKGQPARTLVLSGADLHIEEHPSGQTVSGTIHDPYWGDWQVEGRLGPGKGRASLTLRTSQAHVTQRKLESIPFIAGSIWEHVKAEGPTAAEITLHIRGEKEGMRYHVDLRPRKAAIDVPSIGLHSTDTTGRIVVEGALVTLTDLRGRAAGGRIEAAGTLDFRKDVAELKFSVRVRDVGLREFTSEWDLPKQIRDMGGRLTGDADLVVTIGDKVRVNGHGDGRIEGAEVLGEKTTVGLKLRYVEGKPQFNSEPSRSSLHLPGRWAVRAPVSLLHGQARPTEQPAVRPLTEYPVLAASWLQAGVAYAGKAVTEAGKTVVKYFPDPRRAKEAGKPTTYLEVTFSLKDIDLAQLVKRTGVKLPYAVSGRGSLEVQADLPVDTPGDLVAYRARGTVQLRRFRLAELELDQVSARIQLDKGVLDLTELQGLVPDAREGSFAGTARLQVAPFGDVSARLTLNDIPLARVLSLVPALANQVRGTFSGTAEFRAPAERLTDPASWNARADARADRLQVFGWSLDQLSLSATVAKGELSGAVTAEKLQVEGVTVESLSSRWKADRKTIKFDNVDARLFKGKVTGSATAPLHSDATGDVNLRLENIDVGDLARAIKGFPIRLEGRAGGKVEGKLTTASRDRPREFTGHLDLEAQRLRVQNIPTERLRGTVTYRNETVECHLQGSALGGTFDLDGELPPLRAAQPNVPQSGGRFRLREVKLSRLWEALSIQNLLLGLEGVVDLDLTFRQGAKPEDTMGTGRVQITNLRYGDTPVSGRLAGDLRLRGQQLFLPELSGTLGAGQVRLRAGVFLRDLERSWFNLTLDNVESATLLGVFPDLRDIVSGPIDANLRGNLGQEWRGDGEVVLARGRVLGADVTEWRVPLHFEFSPERGSGRIDIRDSSAQVGLGRATGQLHLNWGAGNRLSGTIRFARVELRGLVRSIDSTLSVGAGRITGRLDFSGQDVHSLNDVTARLQGDLNETQTLQFSVFRQITPYLGIPSTTSVQSGHVHAVLGRGVWRIQQLRLESDFLRLFVQGTQTLQGQLNLDVVAGSGRLGINPAVLRLLGVTTVGPVPAEALARASQWLSNRVVYLRVTGTLRSPTIRVEVLPLLTEEVVRFFLYSYAPAAAATRDFLP